MRLYIHMVSLRLMDTIFGSWMKTLSRNHLEVSKPTITGKLTRQARKGQNMLTIVVLVAGGVRQPVACQCTLAAGNPLNEATLPGFFRDIRARIYFQTGN